MPEKDNVTLDCSVHPPDLADPRSEAYGVASYQRESFLKQSHAPVPMTYSRTRAAARVTVSWNDSTILGFFFSGGDLASVAFAGSHGRTPRSWPHVRSDLVVQ